MIVVDPSAVTSISIGDAGYAYNGPVPLGGRTVVGGTWLSVPPTDEMCAERFARTLRVLTPTTCAFWQDGQNQTTITHNGRVWFDLSGLAAGDCTIEAVLDGTAVSARRTFPVTP